MRLKRKKSQRVDAAANRLYAIMASKAASIAVLRTGLGNWPGAEEAAEKAIEYMERAGADAVRWHYKPPA